MNLLLGYINNVSRSGKYISGNRQQTPFVMIEMYVNYYVHVKSIGFY